MPVQYGTISIHWATDRPADTQANIASAKVRSVRDYQDSVGSDVDFSEDEYDRLRLTAEDNAANRVSYLDACVQRGDLTKEDAFSFLVSGEITDDGWAVLQNLPIKGVAESGVPAKSRRATVDCWTARFETAGGEKLPLDIRRTQWRNRSIFPHLLVAEALESVAADGWEFVHLSESREIDQEANRNRISSAAVLVRRDLEAD